MRVRLVDDFNDEGSMSSAFDDAMELARKIKNNPLEEIEIKELPIGTEIIIEKKNGPI